MSIKGTRPLISALRDYFFCPCEEHMEKGVRVFERMSPEINVESMADPSTENEWVWRWNIEQ